MAEKKDKKKSASAKGAAGKSASKKSGTEKAAALRPARKAARPPARPRREKAKTVAGAEPAQGAEADATRAPAARLHDLRPPPGAAPPRQDRGPRQQGTEVAQRVPPPAGLRRRADAPPPEGAQAGLHQHLPDRVRHRQHLRLEPLRGRRRGDPGIARRDAAGAEEPAGQDPGRRRY